jgi:hypothetical protein
VAWAKGGASNRLAAKVHEKRSIRGREREPAAKVGTVGGF